MSQTWRVWGLGGDIGCPRQSSVLRDLTVDERMYREYAVGRLAAVSDRECINPSGSQAANLTCHTPVDYHRGFDRDPML